MQAASTPLVREVTERQLQLLSVAARLTSGNALRLANVFSILTHGSLDRPVAKGSYDGLSHVNVNGLPLQWSVAAGEPVPSVRFLCECGPIGAPGPVRLEASFQRLHEAARLLSVEAGAREAEQLAREHLLPKTWPTHWRSAMWTAAGAAGSEIGLKAYFNLTAGEPADRWHRAGRLLLALGRRSSLERLCHCSGLASLDSLPAGIAIGIGKRGVGAVKIYFRSAFVKPAWLSRWYAACGYEDGEEFARLLIETFAPPGETPYPDGSFVVSLEFPESDGAPALKTEVEVSRGCPPERSVSSKVRHLLRRMGIKEDPYCDAMAVMGPSADATTVHRLVGVRTDATGTRRANIYLEPPLLPVRERRITLPRSPRRAALAWLERARSANGGWSDYRLPVGAADRWVTAYVALHTGRGCDYLEEQTSASGAWGYNADTPDDADSTALAAVALRREGREVNVAAFLRKCLRDDGGVATYPAGTPPGGAWTESVVDVTPVAMEALMQADNPDTLAWLVERQRTDGLWNAYWWLSPLYSTWWVARVFGKRLPPAAVDRMADGLNGWRAAGAFEQALLVLTRRELELGYAAERDELLRMQGSDGSWGPSAWLRLTDPGSAEPWKRLDCGSCFLDDGAVFTTVTAIGAVGE
jgi:hypothetical protein